MKKYLITSWRDEIKEMEVIRETDKCIYIKSDSVRHPERKVLKSSGYDSYYDTWDEAYAALLERSKRAVESAKRQYDLHMKALERVRRMRKE